MFTARYGLSLNIIEVNLSVQRVKAIVQQHLYTANELQHKSRKVNSQNRLFHTVRICTWDVLVATQGTILRCLGSLPWSCYIYHVLRTREFLGLPLLTLVGYSASEFDCCMEWDTSYIVSCILRFQKLFYFIEQNNPICFLGFQLGLIFFHWYLTHCWRVTKICVFTLQLCKTDDANLRF